MGKYNRIKCKAMFAKYRIKRLSYESRFMCFMQASSAVGEDEEMLGFAKRTGRLATPSLIRRYAPYEDACPYGDEGKRGGRGDPSPTMRGIHGSAGRRPLRRQRPSFLLICHLERSERSLPVRAMESLGFFIRLIRRLRQAAKIFRLRSI